MKSLVKKQEKRYNEDELGVNNKRKERSDFYANKNNRKGTKGNRSNKRLCLKIGPETVLAEYIVSQQELLQTFEKICENSIYSYRRQICEGFITIRGGNRVGIVGSGVIENGQVININYISSLNIRIARQQIGCSQKVMSNIINSETNTIYNTLIISPPRMWKNNIIKRYNKKLK